MNELIAELRGLVKSWQNRANGARAGMNHCKDEPMHGKLETALLIRQGDILELTTILDKYADTSAAEPSVAKMDTEEGRLEQIEPGVYAVKRSDDDKRHLENKRAEILEEDK